MIGTDRNDIKLNIFTFFKKNKNFHIIYFI